VAPVWKGVDVYSGRARPYRQLIVSGSSVVGQVTASLLYEVVLRSTCEYSYLVFLGRTLTRKTIGY